MASRETISRLFAAPTGERTGLMPIGIKPENTQNSAPLPAARELPVRARFSLAQDQPQNEYRLTPPDLQSIVQSSVAPQNRERAFAELAMRDALREQARRFGQRGVQRWRRGEQQGTPVIQS